MSSQSKNLLNTCSEIFSDSSCGVFSQSFCPFCRHVVLGFLSVLRLLSSFSFLNFSFFLSVNQLTQTIHLLIALFEICTVFSPGASMDISQTPLLSAIAAFTKLTAVGSTLRSAHFP